MAGFAAESPGRRFVILAESGRCENLLQDLEIRMAAGYRVVQCWESGGAQGFPGVGASVAMTYALLEKVS